MEFKRGSIQEYWDKAIPLFKRHHDETGSMEGAEFNPAKEKYFALDQSGNAKLFVAIEKEDHLCGYCIFFVFPHHHYQDHLWAVQDVLFVEKEHRGFTACRFVAWCDEELKKDGVKVVARLVHPKNDYSRLLESLGYNLVEMGYMRKVN